MAQSDDVFFRPDTLHSEGEWFTRTELLEQEELDEPANIIAGDGNDQRLASEATVYMPSQKACDEGKCYGKSNEKTDSKKLDAFVTLSRLPMGSLAAKKKIRFCCAVLPLVISASGKT